MKTTRTLALAVTWAMVLGGFCRESRAAKAPPARVLVSIGNNVGSPQDEPLAFAELDAQRVARVFVEVGEVAPERAYVLLGRSAADVRRRMAEVAGRVAELRASGREVILFVYVSSHAEAGVLQLRGTTLPLEELRSLATQTRSQLQVLIVDACASGQAARRKGGKPAKPYSLEVQRLPLSGQVVLTSSGPAEPSQEWDSLKGSLFTHHLLAALRGDADSEPDGRVTLSEAYLYSYRRTVLESAQSGQHPSYDFDLAGSGELVLTHPSAARSALLFDATAEGRYVIGSQPRPDVLLEVEKKRGRPLRLAIPPGRYVLRKRMGATVGLLELELPFGGEHAVDERQMTHHGFADIALKGTSVVVRPSALLVFAQLDSAPVPESGARTRIGVGYRRIWARAYAQGVISAGPRSFAARGLSVSEVSGAVTLSGGYRVPWGGLLLPHVGFSLELTYFRQTYERQLEAFLEETYPGSRSAPRWSAGVSAGPELGVELPLWSRWFAVGEAQVLLRHLPVEAKGPWSAGFRGRAGIGVRF